MALENAPAQTRIARIQERISKAEQQFGQPAGSVRLLVVSKKKPASEIRATFAAGQRAFGENYAQEAISKITELDPLDIQWHFIGPIQSNKTRLIAEHFSWVHSVDRLTIAERLSRQRSADLPPLNICLQVNVSNEPTKSGVTLDGGLASLSALASSVAELPHIRLRGLMAIPVASRELSAQRKPFLVLREVLEKLKAEGLDLDTLSMGMSDDMEAAIAEGATIVRIGTAIFGPRG